MKFGSVIAFFVIASMLGVASPVTAQLASEEGSASTVNARVPSDWVSGPPGRMSVLTVPCHTADGAELRRRIVDIAAREWSYFGLPVVDRVHDRQLAPLGMASGLDLTETEGSIPSSPRGPRLTLNPQESARVAAAIAGYWAATPTGAWFVSEQNGAWSGPRGIGSRWVAPWSAAFISWVMCEAGLDTSNRFHRAIAHWTYIDQAIRARDGRDAESGFVAYDIGEVALEPGDLLCAGRRPEYRTLADRRRQMGVGASSHCDIVVKVDGVAERVLTIGGNVRGTVSLKVFPATMTAAGYLRPEGGAGRTLFAHLKLRADPIESDALDHSPDVARVACAAGSPDANARIALVTSIAGTLLGGANC